MQGFNLRVKGFRVLGFGVWVLGFRDAQDNAF